MCFSTICYHYDYLRESLRSEDMFCSAPIFRDIPSDIRKLVKVAYPWDATKRTPSFSGIPPHITTLAELERLKRKLHELTTTLKQDFITTMNDRVFSSTEYKTKNLVEAPADQSAKIVAEVLKKANLQTVELTRNYAPTNNEDDCIILEEDYFDDDFDTKNDLTETEKSMRREKEREASNNAVAARKYTLGFHHGRLNPLPADFQWPKMTTQQLCINWLVGNRLDNIPPFCTLSTKFSKT